MKYNTLNLNKKYQHIVFDNLSAETPNVVYALDFNGNIYISGAMDASEYLIDGISANTSGRIS